MVQWSGVPSTKGTPLFLLLRLLLRLLHLLLRHVQLAESSVAVGPDQDGRAGVVHQVTHRLQGPVGAGRGGALSRPAIHGGEEVHRRERLNFDLLVVGSAAVLSGEAVGRTIMESVKVGEGRRDLGGLGGQTLGAQRGERVHGRLQENRFAFVFL